MEQAMGPTLPGVVSIVPLIIMIGMIAAWIIFLVAIWRGMKAHESIAQSLKQIAQK